MNLAYFGVFYATRGLTELVTALERLPHELRQRLRLHVFTADPQDLRTQLLPLGLDDVVRVNPYVGYLDFLALTTRFDVLLVNDAATAETHEVNPYLTSKWSDYAGSGRPVWGIVESGSALSSRSLADRSLLGDVDGALSILRTLAGLPATTGSPGPVQPSGAAKLR